MYRTACPSCGAPVEYRSAASVVAVCEYCRSTLLRDAESVRDIGKMADLLADFSPLQIGTSGQFEGGAFTLVGRTQLHYERGLWNEWYALFDDGTAGWLADFCGQYVFTRPIELALPSLPLFEQVAPGNSLRVEGRSFFAADVREARCIAGQGELPFAVGPGWSARLIDYRCADRFLTLDWSDGPTPAAYLGRAVDLAQLHCQLLRDPEQIRESTGRLPGSAAALDCPGCGSPIAFSAGLTPHLVCPSCHSEMALTGDRATVLATQRAVDAVATTLALGDVATIDGLRWTILGLARWQELGEADGWTEYLLFDGRGAFRWLVESAEGWEDARSLDDWPDPVDPREASLAGRRYGKQFDYAGRADYVAGAFPWRLSAGDEVQFTSYRDGTRTLTREASPQEVGWSHAEARGAGQVMGWFGRSAPATPPKSAPGSDLKRLAMIFSAILLVLNLPSYLGDGGDTDYLIFGLLALWVPVLKEPAGEDD